MRILFLSNFYPPYEKGGYEQLCHEVASRLKARGHTTAVLTSNYGVNGKQAHEDDVYRLLNLEVDLRPYRASVQFFLGRKRRERHNLARFRQVVERFKPDIVFAWGMWNLHHSILSLAESLEWIRVVYYLADTWPSLPDAYTLHWQEPARRWYTQLPKRLLGTIALKMLAWDSSLEPLEFEHAICVSTAVREILVKEGLPLKNARIIHNGIDLDHFLCTDELRNLHPENGLSLLYAGRLAPEKGVDTAIEALARLSQKRSLPSITLAIIGAGHPDYEAHLLKLVARKGLQNRVAFCRRVPREEMPELLRQFDVLVFTSICQEALARIVQEAMASGLVVVGTETGGSREILVGDKNALTFVPGDANGLAAQIERLVANPSRYRRLAEAGRRTVVEKFNINRMVNEIEEYLQRVLTTSVRR